MSTHSKRYVTNKLLKNINIFHFQIGRVHLQQRGQRGGSYGGGQQEWEVGLHQQGRWHKVISQNKACWGSSIHIEENSWGLISCVQGRDHIWRRSAWGVKQACLSGWQCRGKDLQVTVLSWKSAKSYHEYHRGGFKEGSATLKGAQGDVFSFTYSQDVMAGPSRSYCACIF